MSDLDTTIGRSVTVKFGREGYEAFTAVEFASRRRAVQDHVINRLLPLVRDWLVQPDDPAHQLPIMERLSEIYVEAYMADGGERRARTAGFLYSLRGLVNHTEPTSDPRAVATWLAVTVLNAAVTQAASESEKPLLLEWTTMHDNAVRPEHASADGQRRPPGTLFNIGGENLRYPGDPRGRIDNTINCVVGSTQVIWPGDGVRAASRRLHRGAFIELLTARGHVLTVTPNHPVLTPRGYVPAELLGPGDQVIASPLAPSPEVADGPPRIEQLHGALSKAGVQQRVVGSRVQFHGDGSETEVEVVRPDRDLLLESGVLSHRPLVRSGLRQGPGAGDGHEVEVAPVEVGVRLVPASGFMGRAGEDSSLLWGESRHAEAIGLRCRPSRQSEFGESTGDHTSVDADFSRHLQNALSLGMTPCEIVHVERYLASHHVYNLDTSSGMYIGNGIAQHNCRCVLRVVSVTASALTAALKESTMPFDAPLPWHGVLAPEDEWSGDGRRFAAGALRNRDLPLPLTWQRSTGEGHNGSTVVAKIESIERVDNMIRGEGVFIDTPETDEVIGLIAEFGRFGVSVDADDSEFEFDEKSNKVTFTSARIASASLVSIPAFASAFVALGTWAEADGKTPPQPPADDAEKECDPSAPDYEDCLARKAADDGLTAPGMAEETDEFISEESWNGSAGRFTPEQWKRSTILHVCDGMEKSCHKLPIREPGGALSRAGVHAAASRFNQVDAPAEAKASAARQLRGAYKQLGEEVPDALKAADEDAEEFGRGPGWITNPEDTRRIWAYWTKPGHEGYEKINWGVPGDFNRCRVEVGEEIGESSPEKLRFINQICAQWHHDATGGWPGHAPTEGGSLKPLSQLSGPSLSLVADAEKKAPAAWFENPQLTSQTHLTVTDEGRVFGHLAAWRTCHIGYDEVCVAPPSSASGYAYYATGRVLLDNGKTAQTGVISIGGGHAGASLGARAAAAHYDSSSSAVADVSVGEDEYGIWCAGWVRPGVTQEQVIALRASDVSGDWREIGGNLELVAALAVNVAGFPVAAVHNQTQVALVAAGAVPSPDDELTELITGAVEAAFHRRDRMAKLRERMGAR